MNNTKIPRTELHLHTKMSLWDSVISVHEAAKLANSADFTAIAVTDLNSIKAFPELYNRADNSKIIYGAQVKCPYSKDGHSDTVTLTLLVKSQSGVKKLYQIISAAISNTKNDNLSDYDFVAAHREGLLIGYSCDNVFVDSVPPICDYIEVAPPPTPNDESRIERVVMYGKEHNIPVAAVSNAHYLKEEDAVCRDILRVNMDNNDEHHNLYLRTTDEMLSEFSFLDEETAYEIVVENPNKIAESIENIVPIQKINSTFTFPKAEENLKKICIESAYKKYGEPLPLTVKERLDAELSLIIEKGYASHFLLYCELATFAERLGYHVNTRVSVGSSLVAHLIGISEVNPLTPHYLCPECHHIEFTVAEGVASGFDLPDKFCPKCGVKMRGDGHNIPYETLLGLNGEKAMYIDMNFPTEIHEKVIEHLISVFGIDRIAYLGASARMPEKRIDELTTEFSEKHGIEFTDEERAYIKNKLDRVVIYNGRQIGLFIVPDGFNLGDFSPVITNEQMLIPNTLLFDYYLLENVSSKVTIPGSDTLRMYKCLEERTGTKISDVPMNAPEIYELINAPSIGSTSGLPELGTKFAACLIVKTHPECFSDLVKLNGLAHGTGPWSGNAEKLIENDGKTLNDIIAFRDDVMLYLQSVGMKREDAFRISESVRRGKFALSDEHADMMREYGVPEWYIESCGKIQYLIPKAHAVEQMMTAVRLAWYKIHYPTEFYAAKMG